MKAFEKEMSGIYKLVCNKWYYINTSLYNFLVLQSSSQGISSKVLTVIGNHYKTYLQQHLDEFLNQNGWNIHSILGDGKCLFRALSHQLYMHGTDEHHLFLWTTIVRYESLNRSTFETY